MVRKMTPLLVLHTWAQIQGNEDAWLYFSQSTDSYRKNAIRWIMKAKREETRKKRLDELIECSEQGVKINLLR